MKNGFAEKNYSVTSEDLKKINGFSRRELSAEDVYVFSLTLCDNRVDREYECFSDEALDELAELFVGKTGIFDHCAKAENQVARTFECHTEYSGETDEYGKAVKLLKAKAYIPKTEKNKDLIEEIESGIKKEVSVSCSMTEKICSICGEDMRSGKCVHRCGKTYDGELCYGELSGASDAYEWSFVAVPAQKGAGITKSFMRIKGEKSMNEVKKALSSVKDETVIDKKFAEEILNYIGRLEEKSKSADMYRKQLAGEVNKLCSIVLPSMDKDTFISVAEELSVDELLAFKSAFSDKANEIAPLNLQLADEKTVQRFDSSQFNI